MNDRSLNDLLRWGIENSEAQTTNQPKTQLSPDVLSALLGGPSDADLMREAMTAIRNPEVNLENKLIAFDNFEQLIESIDNANNLEKLGLWGPLVEQLKHEEPEIRRMAAWCVGTAVQNNVQAQERLFVLRAIPTLVNLAIHDDNQGVRKKAILALSSGVRNYQPSLNTAIESLPDGHKVEGKLDAADMASVDTLIQKLRESSHRKG